MTSASRTPRPRPTRSPARAISSSTAVPPTRCTATRSPTRPATKVMTWWEPHGVTGHIVPWNYPMQIIGRSVGAALAMGNACVVKPGEDASLTRAHLLWQPLALEVGAARRGVLNYRHGLRASGGGAPLVAQPGISARVLHGLGAGGAKRCRRWGAQRRAGQLELGGKSPQLRLRGRRPLSAPCPSLCARSVQNTPADLLGRLTAS